MASTKRRSSKGKGSVYRDAERQTWVGAAVVGGKRIRVRAKTKLEARQKLMAAMEAPPTSRRTSTRASTIGPDPTIGELLADWLRRIPSTKAPSTKTRYRWAAALIDEELGFMQASTVRVAHVEQFLEVLATKGLGQSSLRHIRSTLRQLFADAIRRETLERNPVIGANLPADARPTKRRQALGLDDARALLEVLAADDDGLPFLLQLRLGLRPGEAGALYWDSVDLAAGTLTISRGVQLHHGKAVVVDDLKVESARRTLQLPTDVWELMKRRRRTHLGPLMFMTAAGNPLDPAAQRRLLGKFCDRAGVPRVSPNELRHTAASLLLDSGAAIEQVADLLGHTTTRMLDQTYRHRVRPAVEVAARVQWAARR